MLEILGKILKEIRKTERAYENAQSLLTPREKGDLEIITKMYRQQKNHFQSKGCRESIPNRIVSISKSYVRPIVRGQGEWDTDIFREARKAVQRGEEGKRPCQKGTCQGEGESDGGLVRHTERALQPKAGQGSDEVDGNPVHLLRHPHGKRGAAGGQDRTESIAGACLKLKHAHRKVLSKGNYVSVIENRQIIRPKRPE